MWIINKQRKSLVSTERTMIYLQYRVFSELTKDDEIIRV